MRYSHWRALSLAAALGGFAGGAQAATPTLTPIDVGFPVLLGSTTESTDATGGKVYTIVGGGDDIWNSADNFHFAYFPVTGNFDYVVRVQSLEGPDAWTKAELMARESDPDYGPEGGDRFIAQMTTRSGGQNNVGMQFRLQTKSGGCAWPSDIGLDPKVTAPTYPNTWLRLERDGNVFFNYVSTDGKAWTLQSRIDTAAANGTADVPPDGPFASKLVLGLAVTAHNNSDLNGATAVFSDLAPHVAVPIAITTQPAATVNLNANNKLELSVAATGDPVHYQWRKDGKDIAGAMASTYTVALAQLSDAGTYSVRLYGAGAEVVSANSVVTVTTDVMPPSLAKVSADETFTSVTVTYSEPVDATAENKANYALSNGATVSSVARIDGFKVALTTSKLAEGTEYTLTVNNVKDTANNTIAADSKLSFKSWVWFEGYVMQKKWENVTDNTIAGLTGDARFPNSPDLVTLEPMWEYGPNGSNESGTSYGNQLVGWFTPAKTGNYVFFTCSDDPSNLYLSTDDTAANKHLIAQEAGWSNARTWVTAGSGDASSKRSDLFLGNEWPSGYQINLTAGKKYYMESLHTEGSGGDSVSATFIMEGENDPVDGDAPKFTGSIIGTFLDATGAKITFTQQPADVTTAQNLAATFTVAAAGESAYGTNVTFRWQKAAANSSTFADIAGAAGASYTTPLLALGDSGTQFRAIATIPGLISTSAVAKVTVSSDAVPPQALAAGALKGATSVGVTFSELLDPASAETASNYKVNGTTPTKATLQMKKYVELTVGSAISANFTVTVAGVKDLAGNAMASATVNGTLSDMISSDIGDPGVDPLQPGYAVALGDDSYLVAGGGHDIWDNADGFHFLYQEFTGPFDARVRVEGMNPNGPSTTTTWAKAELMVRETTAAGSRHNSVCTTRAEGENAIEAQYRDTTDGTCGNLRVVTPVPYPNAWLRLVRESASSNDIKLYTSTDGSTWTLQNTHANSSPVLPAKVLIGMAVTSHDNTGNDILAQGLYRSFSVKTFSAEFKPDLKISAQGGKPVITWATGTLVSSPTAKGTYAPVAGASSPYTVTPEAGKTVFYQVMQ